MLCSKYHQSAQGLTDAGLCEGCCMQAEERRVGFIELARAQHQEEAEIDDNAQLSEGDDYGCYVQAWVWADFGGTKFDKEATHGKT